MLIIFYIRLISRFDLADNSMHVHDNFAESWKVTIVDTGLNTNTGGRIKRVQRFIGDNPFMMTYGDAVSDVDISKIIDFHKGHGKMATLTAVQPGGRFGMLDIDKLNTLGLQRKEKRGWRLGKRRIYGIAARNI